MSRGASVKKFVSKKPSTKSCKLCDFAANSAKSAIEHFRLSGVSATLTCDHLHQSSDGLHALFNRNVSLSSGSRATTPAISNGRFDAETVGIGHKDRNSNERILGIPGNYLGGSEHFV